MEDRILGLHPITAISGQAKPNLDFYTKVLGFWFLTFKQCLKSPDYTARLTVKAILRKKHPAHQKESFPFALSFHSTPV